MSTIVAQSIEGLSSGGVNTFKRPSVHLVTTQVNGTYAITNNDFSYGGTFGLITGSSAIDFTWDAYGGISPQVTGLYMIYASCYLYANAASGTMALSTQVNGSKTATYWTGGSSLGNVAAHEWAGISGRVDHTAQGFMPLYLQAGDTVHMWVTNMDLFIGPVYHRMGAYKLD